MFNIVHTCHVRFHVDFSSTENVMGCGSKLPSCKPKVGAHDTLNHWEFKDSQESWPNVFCVNMPWRDTYSKLLWNYGECLWSLQKHHITYPLELVELYVKFLKEGQNREFDPSLRKTFYYELLSSLCIGAYIESWRILLGSPFSTS